MCFSGKLVGTPRPCAHGGSCDENDERVCIPPRQPQRTRLGLDPEEEQSPIKPFDESTQKPVDKFCVTDLENHDRVDCPSLFGDRNVTIPGTGCRMFYDCQSNTIYRFVLI